MSHLLQFLGCSDGGKVLSAIIFEVDVNALQQAGFDDGAFHERGGIYQSWSQECNNAGNRKNDWSNAVP